MRVNTHTFNEFLLFWLTAESPNGFYGLAYRAQRLTHPTTAKSRQDIDNNTVRLSLKCSKDRLYDTLPVLKSEKNNEKCQ